MAKECKRKAIIVDIDDTITKEPFTGDLPISSNREEWNKYHEVREYYNPRLYKPVSQILDIIKSLCFIHHDVDIIFITSREDTADGKIRKNTCDFVEYALTKTHIVSPVYGIKVYMRKENDFRSSSEVKEEYLVNDVLPYYDVIVALDDDIHNVEMFKRHNIVTLQPRL